MSVLRKGHESPCAQFSSQPGYGVHFGLERSHALHPPQVGSTAPRLCCASMGPAIMERAWAENQENVAQVPALPGTSSIVNSG